MSACAGELTVPATEVRHSGSVKLSSRSVGSDELDRTRTAVQAGGRGWGSQLTFEAAELPDLIELITALKAVPELKVAAGEVLYQSMTNRAGVALLRTAALELRGVGGRKTGSRE
jgi:hypothetical protein